MCNQSTISAIILAAGLSTRIPQDHKLAKTLDGKPLICHAVDTVCSLNLLSPVIVVGPGTPLIKAHLQDTHLNIVENPATTSGMASSISCGVAALPTGATGFFMVLADMPLITQEDYEALAEAFLHTQTDQPICVPSFEGRHGHPVLFSAAYKTELEQLTGDVGAKSVLARNESKIIDVPRPSNRILKDFDTLDDFDRHDKR